MPRFYRNMGNLFLVPFSDIPNVEFLPPADDGDSNESESDELQPDSDDETDFPPSLQPLRTTGSYEDMETPALDDYANDILGDEYDIQSPTFQDLEAMFDALWAENGLVPDTVPPPPQSTPSTLRVTSDRDLAANGLVGSENAQLIAGEPTLNISGIQQDPQNQEEHFPLSPLVPEDITAARILPRDRGTNMSRSPSAHDFDDFEDMHDEMQFTTLDLPDHDAVSVGSSEPSSNLQQCANSTGRLVDRLREQGTPYSIVTNTRPITLSQVGVDHSAQLSYHEIGTLENVINGWSGKELATPCISCPEKEIIDRRVDCRRPCFTLYLVPSSWNILEPTLVETMVFEFANSHVPSVSTIARATEPAEWANWDVRYTTMVDVLKKLDMKPWNGCYKRFAAVEASIVITEDLGSRHHGRGFNQCLKPVQEWMVTRSFERSVSYLWIRVSTFQNWVSSLWSNLEGIFRHLSEKKLIQGLDHGEEDLYNNVLLWYTFPLEAAVKGHHEPMAREMLVLSSMLSYEVISALLLRQRRIERRRMTGESELPQGELYHM
ncbi:hypothetical protein F5146DRAFT_999280 [Armillaria mellea]|nr:hypothetical protein F5146DRAFT_999280 [Armillaria mellea]